MLEATPKLTDQPMSEQQLTERRPIAESQIKDLDLDLVRRHIRTAVERRGYEGTGDPLAYPPALPLPNSLGRCLAADNCRTPRLRRRARSLARHREIDIAQFSGPHAHSTAMVFSHQICESIIADLLWACSEYRYRLDSAERIEEYAFTTTVLCGTESITSCFYTYLGCTQIDTRGAAPYCRCARYRITTYRGTHDHAATL
jgi:hypothetical protein